VYFLLDGSRKLYGHRGISIVLFQPYQKTQRIFEPMLQCGNQGSEKANALGTRSVSDLVDLESGMSYFIFILQPDDDKEHLERTAQSGCKGLFGIGIGIENCSGILTADAR
jgi:hypothetical protein